MSATRVVLVTGGGRRVGRAIVEELARSGVEVAFTYLTAAQEAEALAAAFPGQVFPFRCELADPAQRQALAEELRRRFPSLFGLVNNAAVFPKTPFSELTPEIFRQVMAVNLEAPLFLAQALAAQLSEGGAIVNIADIYGQLPLRGYTAYVLSKACLLAATKQLAVELAPRIRVNAVAPGIALFPEGYDAAKKAKLLSRTLLGKPGSPEEIAKAVRFLLLEAVTVTGQVLVVDGGRTVGETAL